LIEQIVQTISQVWIWRAVVLKSQKLTIFRTSSFDFFENVLESARAGDVYHAFIVTPFRRLSKSSLFWL